MRRRDQRLIVICAAAVLVALAATLTLMGLRDSVVYFVTPTDIAEKAKPGAPVRLGGLVETGSVHNENGVALFTVSDHGAKVDVRYNGLLPDLFREGQGVIVEGVYRPGAPFEASRVLAKHDETYMPRELVEALKKRGEWKPAQ
jgi:cytochrome c-type biogenesis protein CcmE